MTKKKFKIGDVVIVLKIISFTPDKKEVEAEISKDYCSRVWVVKEVFDPPHYDMWDYCLREIGSGRFTYGVYALEKYIVKISDQRDSSAVAALLKL
jgi:hypothetical protein